MFNKRISIDTRQLTSYVHSDYGSLDVQMMQEDIHSGILPFSLKREKTIIKFLNSDQNFEQTLIEMLPNRYYNSYYGNDINESILEFIENLCLELVRDGTFCLELVCDDDNAKNNYHLIPFYADNIIERKKYIYQVFNKKNQKKFNLPSKIGIKKDNCFVFKWPDSLGGVSNYRKLLKSLSSYDVFEKSASLQFKSLQGQLKQYSFSEHHRILDEIKWKLTKEIGWHHRTFNDYEQPGTEHYKFARLLKFKKAQIILRDHLIEKIKEMIRNISNRFRLNVKLEIEGLMTVNEINHALEKWYLGELEYDDISKIVY